MSLSECMRKTTWRQFMIWTEWIQEEWNIPDKSDYYAMQIAHEVRYSNRKFKPFKTESYLVKFSKRSKVPSGLPTKEEWLAANREAPERSDTLATLAKARWGVRIAAARNKNIRVPPPEHRR